MASLMFRPSLTISRVSFAGCVRTERRRSVWIPAVSSPNLTVSMCLNESSTRTPGFEANTSPKHTKIHPEQLTNEPVTSYPSLESTDRKVGGNTDVHEEDTLKAKRHAKLHDFCLGIPFGGIIFSGGLFGFLFSRNPACLTTGVMLGGAILALGVMSLKVWRKGLSSAPMIVGQAALAATLLWKNLQVYSLTKKIFPTGFYVTLSAAMLCFYAYVFISGGNPPPKKKLATATPL
ncbi:protein FATTY ACID EXPORT 1, chloroplastic [Iris pallida]|uniref:Protein FATTY ACID EXPORT 1, chloroplastic n=1 Tax=Iris pallida TaxID=29817 RepID=A0AAX6FEE4_IRIPA|nr:protein FATTY ACID EXPORT 1, chloroplastic [Iris pallida]